MCNVLAEKIKFETRQVIVLVSITFFPKSPGNMGIIALHASGIKRVKSMRRGRQHFKMTVCSRDGNLYIFENGCLEVI